MTSLPPASPRAGHRRTGRPLLIWLVCYAALAAAVCSAWRDSDVPAAAAVPATEFSAARARVHLDALAGAIGRRIAGTPPAARAADYIEAELRKHGIATERQLASGAFELAGTTNAYRGVSNVLARIPGTSPRAILISAHYDSAAEGPGAGDNALGVATALEVARALRAAGTPEHTVIFNFNAGEELGLVGAAAFVQHPWFASVDRFINLDASGGSGPPLLFQASPGDNQLVETFARAAPHPHGTILAQEIFSALPFDTDYHVYRGAGLAGLDLAPYQDNYAYHTALDRPDRVSQRTLQDSGDNVLALARALRSAGPAAPGPTRTYYDVLGIVMVHYPPGTALVLGLAVAIIALVLACWPRRFARLAIGVASVALSTLFAITVPIAVAGAVSFAGKAMSWYARPWLAAVVYGTFTLAGVLIAQAALGRLAHRRKLAAEELAAANLRGLVVTWAIVLALASALGAGAAYVPLWWCAGCAIALAATRLPPTPRWIATLAGLAIAMLTTAQAAHLLVTSLVPMSGVLGPDAPVEIIIAAVTAVALAPFATIVVPWLSIAPLRPLAIAVAAAACLGLAAVALVFPYTAERAKRVYVEARAGGATGTRLDIETTDAGRALPIAGAALAGELRGGLPTIAINRDQPGTLAVEVAAPGAYLVEIQLDGGTARLALDGGAPGTGTPRVQWTGTAEPLQLAIDRRGAGPGHIHVTAYYAELDRALASEPSTARTVQHALELLPDWTTVARQTILEASAAF